MQLVAYGAQDVYLTGNPQITFFKVVYRRHTNFSMEAVQQTWNGQSLADGQCTATIARNGDLIHKMYIEVLGTVGAGGDTTRNPGSAWITNVELEIGGQRIDRQSGLWMETWAELTMNKYGMVSSVASNDSAHGLGGNLLHNTTGLGGMSCATGNGTYIFNVPLMFWFCRNPGLALPLIALQYHEVKVILTHTIATIFANAATTPQRNNLWVDYIYLDTDERRRFAQVSHEYLIEQVQERSLQATTTNELNFNHPVKELIWTSRVFATGLDNTRLRSPQSSNTDDTFRLRLNGHDRFSARRGTYFSRVQVMQHHSGYGGIDVANHFGRAGGANGGGNTDIGQGAQGGGGNNAQGNDAICVYSFALKPEEHQPSGTCNFSRIDTSVLLSQNNINPNSVIFAVNYNVLRIMSGMGGLAYSN